MSDESSQGGSDYIPPNPRDAREPAVPIRSRLCPFTLLLIGISAAVAIYSSMGEDAKALAPLRISLADYGSDGSSTFLPEVQRGEVWRLLTPIFIHFGWPHIVFNMLALRELGGLLERRYGSWRYALLVIALGVGSNVAQYGSHSWNFGGMSGVIFGLFGYIWIQGRMNPAGFGFALSQQAITATMIWFVLCFTGMVGHIANTAHTAGLGLGAFLSWIVARRAGAEFNARRREFRRAVLDAKEEPLHRCHHCGRTDETAPQLEFRVSRDGEEYCVEHLPSRREPPVTVERPVPMDERP